MQTLMVKFWKSWSTFFRTCSTCFHLLRRCTSVGAVFRVFFFLEKDKNRKKVRGVRAQRVEEEEEGKEQFPSPSQLWISSFRMAKNVSLSSVNDVFASSWTDTGVAVKTLDGAVELCLTVLDSIWKQTAVGGIKGTSAFFFLLYIFFLHWTFYREYNQLPPTRLTHSFTHSLCPNGKKKHL